MFHIICIFKHWAARFLKIADYVSFVCVYLAVLLVENNLHPLYNFGSLPSLLISKAVHERLARMCIRPRFLISAVSRMKAEWVIRQTRPIRPPAVPFLLALLIKMQLLFEF